MTVYVDGCVFLWNNKRWGHLAADTVEELQEFAQKIGLKRRWFQDKTLPHYDITINKRRIAIKEGAIAISRRKMVAIMNRYRKEEK